MSERPSDSTNDALQPPGDPSPLTLSASAISTYMRCPMAYHFRYRQNKELVYKHPALARGTVVHECLQSWWAGGDMAPILKRWYDETVAGLMQGERAEFAKDYAHVTALLGRYRDYYGTTPDDMVVVGEEVEINARLDDRTRMLGYVDLVVTMNGGLYAVEFKTSASLPKRMSYLDWDMQPVVYIWGLREMGMPVRGVIFDGLNTYPYKKMEEQPGSKLFERKTIVPNDAKIEEMVRNSLKVAEAIRHDDEMGTYARHLGAGCQSCDYKAPCHAQVEGDEMRAQAALRTRFKDRESRR